MLSFCTWFPVFIFLTATLFGYILHSLFKGKTPWSKSSPDLLSDQIESEYTEAKNSILLLKGEIENLRSKNSSLGEDYYKLTLAFKNTNEQLEEVKKSEKEAALANLFPEVLNLSPHETEDVIRLRTENERLANALKKAKKKKSSNFKNSAEIGDLAKKYKKKKKKYKKLKIKLQRIKEIQQKIDDLKKQADLLAESYRTKKKSKAKKKSKKSQINDVIEEMSTFSFQPGLSGKHNFQRLYGIDQEIHEILNQAGIYTFTDLSNAGIKYLKSLLKEAGPSFHKINPVNWPIQARIAEKGHWDILEDYRKKMKKVK